MPQYKVSYVISGEDRPGSIQIQQQRPRPGEKIELEDGLYAVIEVFDLVPPHGEFRYIHVTCEPVSIAAVAPLPIAEADQTEPF
jgi:hypothetical protein